LNIINNLKLSKTDKTLFSSQAYKVLNKTLVVIYGLFTLVYMLRGNLYKLNNQYITLFAWTAPNLIPSFLFTLTGIFYVVPMLFKVTNVINNSKFIWLINVLNMIIFALIEYLHVIFKSGVWDNKDMIASLIGIIIATIIYFKFRKSFID
jgi:glycopeptide antibiotics resistance protein